MPTCRYSFIHKGKQLCVLEENCALKNPEERQTCQKVHEFYDPLTPMETKDRQKKLIYKLEHLSKSAHTQQIAQSKEKLKGLKITF